MSRVSRVLAPALVKVGSALPPTFVGRLRQALGLVEVGAWAQLDPHEFVWVDGRESLFAIACDQLKDAESPLYLEFGVAEGRSLRWWSEHLRQPGATLVGFDSFEGLPHDWFAWHGKYPKGRFAQESLPQFDDDRVSLQVGWFDQTLPQFSLPSHDALVINLDADLYSSTAFVLDDLAEALKPGTLVYFDDFPMEEKQALADHCSKTGAVMRPIAAERRGFHWLFEVLPS